MIAKVSNIILESPKVKTWEFTLSESINFIPGQYIILKIDNTNVRSYTISSDYKETNKLTITVSVGHDGVGSNYLNSLKLGDTIEFDGPKGQRILKESFLNNIVFLAAGTGITPYIAMLYKLKDINFSKNITLYFGLHDKEELFFKDILDKFKKELPNFNYEIIYSSIDGRLDNVAKKLNDINTDYYVCGPPPMMMSIKNILLENSIPEENIIL